MKYSSVKVYAKEHFIPVKMTSEEKPKIPKLTIEKWQNMVDLIALTVDVPSALIMYLEEKHIRVFLQSKTKGNPFKSGETIQLHRGGYSETVIGNNCCLNVPNAFKDVYWSKNPHIALNMISYLGFPIIWPDGEIFGTICVMDNKENHYGNKYTKLMELFKDSIEKDLKIILEQKILKDELEKRKQAEVQLINSQQKYIDLFDNMKSAVIIYKVKNNGKNFIFEELNMAAQKIEQLEYNNVINKDITDIFPSISNHNLVNIMRQVWEDGIPKSSYSIFYTDDRIEGWRGNYYIYKLSSGEIAVMYDDISEIVEQRKIIYESERRIKEANEFEKLITEFFSNISHELRTPLNIILCILQMVEMNLQNDKKALDRDKLLKNLNIQKQNCFRLQKLVDNLIDTTKINSHSFEIKMKDCNIIELVKDITQSVATYVHINNLSITFNSDVKEKIIACDPEKIERILLNLLSNSIKYTEKEGNIFVNVYDGDEYISIIVEDTGKGIPDDKLNVIFDRFRQVDKSFQRNTEGSGLGLYIVKSLTEMHGGNISVESNYGIGSKFIIKLPAKRLYNETSSYKNDFFDDDSNNNVDRIRIEFSDIYKLKLG